LSSKEKALLRIVQWATGVVGQHAVRAIQGHPDLELVGALVYSDAKNGRDVGEICGIGKIGVTATSDPNEIMAMDADCVLYMPVGESRIEEAIDDICQLLASGKNVISVAVTGLIYPRAVGDEAVQRLEAACAQGGTSFHGTGIEPGWAADVLPLTMTALFRRIESIHAMELMNYSTYDNDILFTVMGFGTDPDKPLEFDYPGLIRVAFGAPLMLVADGLGAEIEDFVYDRQVAVAEKDFEIVAGPVKAGTVSAQKVSLAAIVDGRPALTLEHITRLGDDQAPQWANGHGYKVTIEGEPSMVLEAEIGIHGEDENDQGCIGTAMHAVHAVPHVCAADPGIRTVLDLPMIVARHALGFEAAKR
jgi:hypothetical protein